MLASNPTVTAAAGQAERAALPIVGTVTLIEKCSGAVGFEAVATDQRRVVDISGGSVELGNLTPTASAQRDWMANRNG
jgi:hypothetical protein